ncbi:MAG: LysM peptidoglycan-binding domain-containing protein, partial [Xanthomonadales bacterium]|nr:LysM peptidoglycan-binding domain-containing protein [Xanthomonadales bacterium]
MGQGPHPRLSGSVLVTLLLAGCASTGPAPVEDLGTMPVRAPRSAASNATRAAPHASAHSHRVVRGDTLYSIAFRNGLDYRDVAAWNRIDAPYTIHVGQVLRLTPPAARVAPPRHGGNAPPAAGRSAAGSAPAPFDAPQPTPAAPSAP